jgi:hypothetical protein
MIKVNVFSINVKLIFGRVLGILQIIRRSQAEGFSPKFKWLEKVPRIILRKASKVA